MSSLWSYLAMSMKSVGQRHHDSIEKLFSYVGLLAREDINILFDDQYEYKYPKVNRCIISPTLFRTDSCHSSGRCCKVAFDLAYTEEGLARLAYALEKETANSEKLSSALKVVKTVINNKSVMVKVHLNDKLAQYTNAKTCDFLVKPDEGEFKDRFICGVHTFKPFHCWAPHFVVRKREDDCAFVGRMQFGRNHQFGCPVVFENGMKYFDKDYNSDIQKLDQICDIADDMGVRTWAPQMLDWMLNGKETITEIIKTGNYSVIEISSIYEDCDEPRRKNLELFD